MLELDALRGIAALSVLLFHYANQYDQNYHHLGLLPYTFNVGKYGVQLFFVISGFVIFWTLERTCRAGDFVVHRFARLFPTYWASLAVTLCLVTVAGLPGQQVSLGDALLNATMFPDFLRAEPVDGSYWTLQFELFFYIQMLGWYVLGMLGRIRWIIAGWLLLAVAYVVSRELDWHFSYAVRELLILRYIPYFSAGILMYRIQKTRERNLPDWVLVAAAIGVSGLIWGWHEALILAICVLLFVLLSAGRLRFLARQPLLFLGGISYSLYLLHQEIGYILIDSLERAGLSVMPSILITTVLVILLAWLLSRYVERPAIRSLRRLYEKLRGAPPAPASERSA